MIKTWQSHRTNVQKKISKITSQTKKNIFQIISQNNIRPSHLGDDMFISRSGQVKINNLDSCRIFNSCDFIVF